MFYYLDSFDRNFGFLLREKGPNSLRDAQDKALSFEKHWLDSRKGDMFLIHVGATLRGG